MADEGDEIALAAGFDAQHAKAVVGVVERDAVDKACQNFRGAHRRYLRHYPKIIGRSPADSIYRRSSRFRCDQTSGWQISTAMLLHLVQDHGRPPVRLPSCAVRGNRVVDRAQLSARLLLVLRKKLFANRTSS